MSTQPIGIFDSGVGGLTVMAAIRELLPNESIVYLGDTARVPYGCKSAETILLYTEECCVFLAGKQVKAIVVACNSASANAFPFITTRFHFPVMGVVEAGLQAALEKSGVKHIGVIGTEATIESEIYAKELRAAKPDIRVTSVSCPLFVSLAEVGWANHAVTRQVAEEYLKPLQEGGVDTLILGCTHYPLLKKVIGKVMGEKVTLIDSAEAVAAMLKKELEKKKLRNPLEKKGSVQLFVTDLPRNFGQVAKAFLGDPLPAAKKISL